MICHVCFDKLFKKLENKILIEKEDRELLKNFLLLVVDVNAEVVSDKINECYNEDDVERKEDDKTNS